MKVQRGSIGAEEIKLAITELEGFFYNKDKNLFVKAEFDGKDVSLFWYEDVEELLGEKDRLEVYVNLDDYFEKMKEREKDYKTSEDSYFSRVSAIFTDKKIAYLAICGKSGTAYIDDEKEYPIKALVSSDYNCDFAFFTYDEAMENLKGDIKYLNEDLVIGLLS